MDRQNFFNAWQYTRWASGKDLNKIALLRGFNVGAKKEEIDPNTDYGRGQLLGNKVLYNDVIENMGEHIFGFYKRPTKYTNETGNLVQTNDIKEIFYVFMSPIFVKEKQKLDIRRIEPSPFVAYRFCRCIFYKPGMIDDSVYITEGFFDANLPHKSGTYKILTDEITENDGKPRLPIDTSNYIDKLGHKTTIRSQYITGNGLQPFLTFAQIIKTNKKTSNPNHYSIHHNTPKHPHLLTTTQHTKPTHQHIPINKKKRRIKRHIFFFFSFFHSSFCLFFKEYVFSMRILFPEIKSTLTKQSKINFFIAYFHSISYAFCV